MPRINRNRFHHILRALALFLLLGTFPFIFPLHAFGFSFAVLSDPHGASDSWVNGLTEVKDMTVNPDPKFSRTEFLLVAGDTNPIDMRYSDYLSVFKNSKHIPLFLPVIGNHEFDDNGGMPGGKRQGIGAPPDAGGPQNPPGETPAMTGGDPFSRSVIQTPGNPPGMYPDNGDPSIIDMDFIRRKIIAAVPGVVRLSRDSCSYYYDYKNIRVISLDGYSGEIGELGIINDKGRNWTEAAIESAPAIIDHIFIAFHAPAFPRVRHTHDSFNADPGLRNAFWNMLVAHRDKVRAVFSGHTHYYSRMRVFDPAGAAANDFSAAPDEADGIYQVIVGSTGNGTKNTFLRVEVDEKKVFFRAYEAENGKGQPFSVADEWHLGNE